VKEKEKSFIYEFTIIFPSSLQAWPQLAWQQGKKISVTVMWCTGALTGSHELWKKLNT
jgi:hypothetical protein